ncbi:DEAD/DEAH box helicase [candidate division WOR-3 bacterium]|nr:DEAD/DEAH box helicase [candidate division WOR-3 bacterium]
MNKTIDNQIKKELPLTWTPFFSHFGKLTEIQRKTIPEVLKGENLVISSPKATGKTEAVLAPVVERWLSSQATSLSVIYISPTRALVNDVYRRIKPAYDYLDIPLSRRTGDHPEFRGDKITPFLITTPESLDSLICRYPVRFKNISAVVVDEVHLLYNSFRGDQLRMLIRRIKRIANNPPLYLMSATITDPETLGEDFIEGEFKTALVMEPLTIEYQLIKEQDFLERLGKEIKKRGLRKLLFFVNSRQEAEEMIRPLSLLSRNLWVHHGSMSKKEREEVELAMHRAKSGICVATSTLEFGIDIGDIDAVVLFSPPSDAASLLQRVGRGNRRMGNYILAYGIYLDEIQKIIFEQLFEDAKNRDYLSVRQRFDISVSCQQMFSYIYQKARVGTSISAITNLFQGLMEPEDTEKITKVLLDKELLSVGKSQLLFPGNKIKNSILYGSIHSNIPDTREVEVYDVASSLMIGKVQNPFPCFSLSGRRWLIVSSEANRIWVKHLSGGGDGQNVFKGKRHHRWDFQFGMRVKERFFPELGPSDLPYIKRDNYFHIFHFTGFLYGFIWIQALREKIKIEDVRDIVFISEGLDIIPEREDILNTIRETRHLLTNYMNLGKYFYLLPGELQEKQVISSLRTDQFLEWLSKVKFVSVSPDVGTGLVPTICVLKRE